MSGGVIARSRERKAETVESERWNRGYLSASFGEVRAMSAADRSAQIAGGGYPPSPDLYIPTICNGATCTERQAVCLGPNCLDPGSLKFEARIRTYWFRKVE